MKQILFIALLGFAAVKFWPSIVGPGVQPLHGAPYVAVYGRNNCGVTQAMLKTLRQQGIQYEYHLVDEPQVADLLHSRMESSGLSTRRYNLPVVDVSGTISVRPSPEQVLKLLRKN